MFPTGLVPMGKWVDFTKNSQNMSPRTLGKATFLFAQNNGDLVDLDLAQGTLATGNHLSRGQPKTVLAPLPLPPIQN